MQVGIMAISANLQLRQSQSLVMTPQLMQSIKLLQLNNVELSDFVAAEIEKNPVLEYEGDENSQTREPSDRSAENQAVSENADLNDVIAANSSASPESLENGLDGGSENLYDSEPAASSGATATSSGSKLSSTASTTGPAEDYNLEEFVTSSINLHDYLTEQANLEFHSPSSKAIAMEIIGALDDDGYLREPTTEIAALLGVSNSLVLETLKRVQRLEPAGIAARNLKECLALQLIEKNRFDPAMQAMIDNIELLAKREFARLKKICQVNEEDLYDMIREVRELDPRPGLALQGQSSEIVVPDVFVRESRDGAWSIELNQDTLPRVLVNRSYYSEVTSNLKDDAEKDFMVDCLQNANWLVKSLDQRAQTILKVATEIVKQQDMFLAYGIEYLKPLNLKTVADEIGMHESTVSRVTSNKYIMTSRGLFEMKYFFSNALQSSNGSVEHSSESVKHLIRQMIDKEEPGQVLSDDALVDALRGKGIDIARRTIAKYREAMQIPSSVQRRREKKASALAKAF